MIPEETVREVRERIGILDVVSDYVSLKKSGANYLGLCPFHGEKTPSFNVNPSRGIFHCFGCGLGGNAFSFVMRMEGLTFPEAVKFLARRAGVEIVERPLSHGEQQRRDERETLYHIMELAVEYYRSLLLSGKDADVARQYLERRGVDLTAADAQRIGYASERWDGLCRHLERRGIALGQAEKLGLVRRRENGGHYDLFRNRLLFTIADIHGRPIAFGGRVLDDSLPKYINSPESPIYRKSEVLFGLDLAKQAIREKGAVIVVEGYFDQLSLSQAGVREVVATCGTALTPDHLRLLQRYAARLYTLFDADGAGQKATVRAMDLVLAEAFPAAVVELPAGDDPDSFVKREGPEAFAGRVAQARPIFEFYLRFLLDRGETGTVEGKRLILAEVIPRLRLIGDRIQRRLYVTEVARLLGIEESELRNEVGLAGRQSVKPHTSAEIRPAASGSAEMLLALMGKFEELAVKGADLKVTELMPEELVPLAQEIIAARMGHAELDWSELLERSAALERSPRLAALFVDDAHLEGIDPHKAFDQCCAALQRSSLKDLRGLARELARLEPDSPRYNKLLEEMETLRNKKSLLS